LRKINEEQFLKVFEWLKEKTNNFRVFPEEIFLANTQLILILRCALGMSRSSFARKVGIFQKTLQKAENQDFQPSVKMVEEWHEKINKLLNTQEFPINPQKAVNTWVEINLRHAEDDIEESEKIRREMEKLALLEWDMKDRKFLPIFFEFFKEKTNDFTIFPVSLFIADNALSIFFIRCCVGISQRELAEKLGCSKDLVRHLENRHQKIIHIGPALRWIDKLQNLLPKNISFEDFERNWKKIIFSKIEIFEKKESLKKLPPEEIIKKIEELKEGTNNFTNIEKVLEEDGRNIFLFRVICRTRLKELAKILKVDDKEIRRWENGKRRIKPETIEKIAATLKEMTKNAKLEKETLLKNLKDIKSSRASFRKRVQIKNGISLVEKLPPTELEKEVVNFLNSHNIPFKLHATLECNGKLFNVDFAIPDSNNPKIVMEVFTCKSDAINLRARVVITDHRFLIFKMKNPQLKTIMIGEINPLITQETKENIQKEIVIADLAMIGEKEEINQFLQQTLLNFLKENLQ
jgi:transcriptional regulator with XRE-family HTH domain